MFWLCQRSRLGSSAHVTVDQLTEEKKDKILSQIQTTKAGTVTADLYPSIPRLLHANFFFSRALEQVLRIHPSLDHCQKGSRAPSEALFCSSL